MKKVFLLSFFVLAVMALTAALIFAGDNCTTDKKVDAKSACPASATANATNASAQTTCTPEQMAACASAKNISAEECAKLCTSGKAVNHTIAIKGMTCTGCENSLSTALKGVDGVNSVISISYKDEKAVVCVDPTKCSTENLTKAIADKGYQAEIIPAVAKSGTAVNDSKACAAAAAKGACSATCASKAKTTTTSEKSGVEETK